MSRLTSVRVTQDKLILQCFVNKYILSREAELGTKMLVTLDKIFQNCVFNKTILWNRVAKEERAF